MAGSTAISQLEPRYVEVDGGPHPREHRTENRSVQSHLTSEQQRDIAEIGECVVGPEDNLIRSTLSQRFVTCGGRYGLW